MFLLLLLLPPPLRAQPSTNALPPLAPADPELPPTFWEQHGALILLGGFIYLALVAIALWRILKPRPQPVLPPEILAREALARLHRQPEDGRGLSEISQALRRYLVAAFEIAGGELTTAEFSAALAGNPRIGAELAQGISGFLRACDERKFSPAASGAPLHAASRALELIALAERARHGQDARATKK